MRKQSNCLAGLIVLSSVGGCGSTPDPSAGDPEQAGTLQEPIIGGTTSIDPRAAVQFVLLTNSTANTQCTGELLQNDLVLTARHCVTVNSTTSGALADPTALFVSDLAEWFPDHKVVKPSEVDDMGPATDVALLVLNKFVEPDWRQRMKIYSGTDASLQGKSVTCFGYGDNVYIPPSNGLGSSGTGVDTLRAANLSFGPGVTISNNNNAMPWHGDSGSTCISGGDGNGNLVMTGILSGCSDDGTKVTQCNYTGPDEFRSWIQFVQAVASVADFMNTTSSTWSGDSMLLYPPVTDSNAPVTVTPNQGDGSVWFSHNFGVWYGGQWEVFRQDKQSMPIGQGFNVSTGGWTFRTTATSSNTVFNTTVISPAATDPNALLIVTPVWTPDPSHSFDGYHDHAIGVWWNGTSWAIYNEKNTVPMPLGASFNVRWASAIDGAFLHCTDSSNINGRSTILSNTNLDGVSNATVFITHNWNPPGHAGAYLDHPTGVWYDGSHWRIANQDGAAMPAGICFNVMVRP